MFDITKLLDGQQIKKDLEAWLTALLNPGRFLTSAPEWNQFIEGLEFYWRVLILVLAIYAMIALISGRGSIAKRFGMLAVGLINIFFLVVASGAAHLPFWLLGGKATLIATCMAAIYSLAPYGPLIAIGQWIQISAMPSRLRRYALSPGTAAGAASLAQNHPDTNKLGYFLGWLLAFGLLIWSSIVFYYNMSVIHDLGGWTLVSAIVLAGVLALPIIAMGNSVSSGITGTAIE